MKRSSPPTVAASTDEASGSPQKRPAVSRSVVRLPFNGGEIRNQTTIHAHKWLLNPVRIDVSGLHISAGFAVLQVPGFRSEEVRFQRAPLAHVFIALVLDSWKPLFGLPTVGAHYCKMDLQHESFKEFRRQGTPEAEQQNDYILLWRKMNGCVPFQMYTQLEYGMPKQALETTPVPLWLPDPRVDAGRLEQALLRALCWRMLCGIIQMEASHFLITPDGSMVHSIDELSAFSEANAPAELWDNWHRTKNMPAAKMFMIQGLKQNPALRDNLARNSHQDMLSIGTGWKRQITAAALKRSVSRLCEDPLFMGQECVRFVETLFIPYIMGNLNTFEHDLALFLGLEGRPISPPPTLSLQRVDSGGKMPVD
jgi:hypothetical protein